MTNAQKHNLLKKSLYVFQRMYMLGLIVLLLYMEREFFALVFFIIYWNRPEYDNVRKIIRSRWGNNDHPENQKSN